MAGKTLTGIGEDESGRHELAADKSDSAIRAAKPPSTRATDRMPMSTIIGAVPMPAPVDDDKVAEGLKRLRSLDEPLGPIPSSMPTLKEGIPAVGAGAATPVNPAAVAAAAASELLRSRGTAHGHALSAAAAGQGVMPLSVDDRMKGTLLGHSLHLPDLPEVVEESRPAEVHSVARIAPAGALTPGEMNTDFSHGDARFFDSEPPNVEFEPERRVRSHKMMVRGMIFAAVVSVCIVAAIAWTRSRRSEAPAAVPIEAHATPEATPPPDNNAAPAAAAPTPDNNAAPAPAPAAAAPPPAAAPEEAKPAAVIAPPPEAANPFPAKTHVNHEAAATPRPATHSSPRVARPAGPARETTKTVVPSKHAKVEKVVDDPDGTLPLDE
jgi:hypothetical protein